MSEIVSAARSIHILMRYLPASALRNHSAESAYCVWFCRHYEQPQMHLDDSQFTRPLYNPKSLQQQQWRQLRYLNLPLS